MPEQCLNWMCFEAMSSAGQLKVSNISHYHTQANIANNCQHCIQKINLNMSYLIKTDLGVLLTWKLEGLRQSGSK